MNRQRIAMLLVGIATVLAVSAFILISDQPEDHSTLRQEVTPIEETAQPPAWVGKEQEAKPDYSSVDAEPESPVAPKEAKTVPEKKPTIIEVTEDKVITFSFIDALVDYTLGRFIPKDKYGRPTTKVSAQSVNVLYGHDMTGFKVQGDDINAAREMILDYAFRPETIKTLYAMYAPLYVEQLVESATNEEREYKVGQEVERRTLEAPEIAAMLRLNSIHSNQTASVFKLIANDPSIAELAGQYLQAAKNVDRVNSRLQVAIADGEKTSEEGERLKQAILQREQIKKTIVETMQIACTGCPPKELFYMAMWSYRRVLGDETKLTSFDAAATVLDDLAKRFQTKAAELDK